MELTLPYDYEMENSVLGSVISNEKKFDEIELIGGLQTPREELLQSTN